MEFDTKDLVVIAGTIKTDKSCKLTATIFEVCYVGLQDLLVFPIHGYNKSIVKINKSLCEKIKLKKLVNESIIEPRIGSLVLAWDSNWDGTMKEKFVGHIQEIQTIPGKEVRCMILNSNKTIPVNMSSILLLEF